MFFGAQAIAQRGFVFGPGFDGINDTQLTVENFAGSLRSDESDGDAPVTPHRPD